jgi:hypothetical protein
VGPSVNNPVPTTHDGNLKKKFRSLASLVQILSPYTCDDGNSRKIIILQDILRRLPNLNKGVCRPYSFFFKLQVMVHILIPQMPFTKLL